VNGLEELSRSRLGLASLSLLRTQVLLDESRVVRVEAEQNLLVAERVLLLDASTLGESSALGRTQDALDFGAVDQTGKVGLRDHVGGEEEVLLELGGGGGGAVDGVEGLEGRRGPDDESAKVTTRGELEEVQGVDVASLTAGQVAETLDKILAISVGVVDDERSTTLAVAAATELALSGTELLGLLSLQNILTSTDGGQDLESSRSLGSSSTLEDSGVDDQGNLGNVGNLVTTGEEKRGDTGSSNGRGSSVSPSFLVSWSVSVITPMMTALTSGPG
jgi:hypothetical protein